MERKKIGTNGQRWAHLASALAVALVLVMALVSWARAISAPAASPARPAMPAANGDVITIGVAAPLTGPIAFIGWQEVNAVQLAISETNAAGGVNVGGTFYTATLVVADSACDTTQAITAANELIEAGVVAVVGHGCSGASIAAASHYYTEGIAMVSPSATAPPLTVDDGYTTTFRTVCHDGSGSIRLASFFATSGRMRTAILLTDDVWHGTGDLYEDTYTSSGGTVTSKRTITTTADITPAVTAIQAENVDVIFVTNVIGDQAGEVSRVAHGLGMTAAIAYLETQDDYITDRAGPAAAEGDFGATGTRRTSNMAGYASFESAYVAAGFVDEPLPGTFSAYAYDAASIIIDAVGRSSPTDTLAIRDAVAATSNYSGVVGTYIGFDVHGDVIPQWARIEVVENGEWVPAWLQEEVYPELGGTVDLMNSMGQTTTIEIPAGTTTQSLVITYSLVATVTNAGVPTLTMIGQHAIRLEPNVSVSNPMTITVAYSDEDVRDAKEATLTLYTWDGGQWVDAEPCGGYVRDVSGNVLQAVICHFSDYALLGERKERIYLPLVLRSFSP